VESGNISRSGEFVMGSDMAKRYKGSCLCGQVTFDVAGFSNEAAACHCTMCRKFHGAAFGTLVEVDDLRWLSGEDVLQDYVGSNATVRKFCSNCGSSLAFLASGAEPDKLELAVSCFDEDIPVEIDTHIYTRYKACWYDLPDTIPNHPEGRDS